MRLRHEEVPASRSIHHLALNTDDMRGTVDFCTQVLGMPLIGPIAVGAKTRSIYFYGNRNFKRHRTAQERA